MRMPSALLEQQLSAILEGILLWAEDSKNKFKLKVLSANLKCKLSSRGSCRKFGSREEGSKPSVSHRFLCGERCEEGAPFFAQMLAVLAIPKI